MLESNEALVESVSFRLEGPGVSLDPGTGEYTLALNRLKDGLTCAISTFGTAGVLLSRFRLNMAGEAVPLETPPILETEPALTGSGLIGEPLTVYTGTWKGTPAPQIAFRWFRDGQEIVGHVFGTYTPAAEDDRSGIACRVTATNAAGMASHMTGLVNVAYPAPSLVAPIPDVSFEQGAGVRTVAAGSAFQGSGVVFSVTGANASIDAHTGLVSIPTDRLLDAAEAIVTGTNSGGNVSISFRVSVVRAEIAPGILTEPSLSGAGSIGQAMTLQPGTWTGLPEPVLGFQWRRNGSQIPGATGATYAPAAVDDQTDLTALVTATNSAGTMSRSTAARRITYVAPTTVGTLSDVTYDQGEGTRTVATAAGFSGSNLTPGRLPSHT